MTRNVPLSFLEIEVDADEIKKYVGKPIIFHYLENEQSILSSGMLEDVNEIKFTLKMYLFYWMMMVFMSHGMIMQ